MDHLGVASSGESRYPQETQQFFRPYDCPVNPNTVQDVDADL